MGTRIHSEFCDRCKRTHRFFNGKDCTLPVKMGLGWIGDLIITGLLIAAAYVVFMGG